MNKKILTSVLSFLIICMFGVVSVHAQGSTPPGGGIVGGTPGGGTPVTFTLSNPFGGVGDNLLTLMNTLIDNVIMPIGGVLIVLTFIWIGFRYVWARGNSSEIKKVHEMLKAAIIGSVILLGAAAIAQVIKGTLEQLK